MVVLDGRTSERPEASLARGLRDSTERIGELAEACDVAKTVPVRQPLVSLAVKGGSSTHALST
ncbi:MAG TPA: hypothetical protein PKA61_15925 [Nitrospira sp.]|nr:hypothetical protein [Nitrospira sp.]